MNRWLLPHPFSGLIAHARAIKGTSVFSGLLALMALIVLLIGAVWVCPLGQCQVPPIDRAGMALAFEVQSPWLDTAMRTVTWAGSIWVLGPLAVLHALLAGRNASSLRAAQVPLSLFSSAAIAQIFKWWIDRPRPVDAPLIALPIDPGYPSAHAMQVTAFIVALLFASGRNQQFVPCLLAATLIVLVGLSRVYLQVHFVTDVLLGIIAALIWAIALNPFLKARGLKK